MLVTKKTVKQGTKRFFFMYAYKVLLYYVYTSDFYLQNLIEPGGLLRNSPVSPGNQQLGHQ